MIAGRPGEDLLGHQEHDEDAQNGFSEIVAGHVAHGGLERGRLFVLILDAFQSSGKLLGPQRGEVALRRIDVQCIAASLRRSVGTREPSFVEPAQIGIGQRGRQRAVGGDHRIEGRRRPGARLRRGEANLRLIDRRGQLELQGEPTSRDRS